MQRKTRKSGNAAIRKSAGPMKNNEEKRQSQKLWAEIDRQLEELGVQRVSWEQAKAKEGRR